MSITHRLSGMYVFFVTLPISLILINKSLSSKSSFENLSTAMSSISFFSFIVFISFLILWYHVLTGVRHLIMDFIHIGESLSGSYYSAVLTIVIWFSSLVIFFGYMFVL